MFLSKLTIEHCGNNPINAGISIQPKKSLNSEEIIITDTHITNNKNCGIFINNPHQKMTTPISIIDNSFTNNNYAI